MTSWLTSALQTVREKSADALDFVRKDLTEFTTTVKSDTETYINKIKTQEVGDLGLNHFVSKLSGSTKQDNTDEKNFQASTSYDRVHTEVTRLQNDESTYLIDPTPAEAYENWRQTTDFNVDTRKGEIAQLLIDAPHVRSFYAHLVPAQTTHSDFWSRYYYRLHQIEEEEARRTQLLRRAHEICSENNEEIEKNNENDWEESDDEWSTNVVQKTTTTTTETVPIEDHVEEQPPSQEQESVSVISTSEKPTDEPSESDTGTKTDLDEENINKPPLPVSGDSWEREFDETDNVPSEPLTNPLTQSEETITTESLPLTTASSSTVQKKTTNEFDDEWEAWS